MDTDHSQSSAEDGQAPPVSPPPSAIPNVELTQPSPRVGDTGLSQAPAPAGLGFTPPSQPASSPYGAPLQPASPAPQSSERSRRNWTPCYVTACLFLLLALVGAVALAIWAGRNLGQGVFGSVFSVAMRMEELRNDVNATPIESIKNSAASATIDEIRANPAGFNEQWLVLETTLTDEPSQSAGNAASGGTQITTPEMMYPVDPPVVILDISGNPAVAHKGDTIRAYGKGMECDFSNISEVPLIGQVIEEAIKNDPQFKGQTSVYMFITKQVELVSSLPAGAASDGQQESDKAADGKQDPGAKDGGEESGSDEGVNIG